MLLICPWVWNLWLWYGESISSYILREKRFYLPQQPSTPNSSSVWSGASRAPSWSIVEFLIGLILGRSCVGNQRGRGFKGATAMSRPEGSISRYSPPSSDSYSLSDSSSMMVPEPWGLGGRVDVDVQLVAEQSQSLSLSTLNSNRSLH